MRTPSRSTVTIAATVSLVIAAALIAAVSLKYYQRQAASSARASQQSGAGSASTATTPPANLPKVVTASLPGTGFRYMGVYEGSDTSVGQYAQVEQFASAIGRQPNLVLYYSGWGEPFSIPYAQTALQHGATLIADIDPTSTSCAAIAAGQEDGFLQSYAQSVKAFGHPVVISFGHEMNGSWYSWGWTRTSPAVFVAAWRHIVDVFRKEGADNVTWLWTVNQVNSVEGPIADYWPGDNYVTWVAFDAYYYYATDDYTAVFGTSIAAVRKITNKPILISETAIGQVAGQVAKLPGLFAGISNSGLLGFVWYDLAQNDGIYHQDWRLEGHPYALSAFRTATARYFR